MTKLSHRLSAIGLAMAVAVACGPLHAQTSGSAGYPSKPVRILTPTPPGGFLDVVGRQLAARLTPALGQPVIVEPKPSAGGMIAMDTAAKSPPDGYTLALCSMGELAVNPSLYERLPYDPIKDFAPVILLFSGPQLLLAHPASQASSVPELIRLARAQPGKLMYGSSGIGFPPHLFTEQFKAIAGIDIVHVPYKGSPAAIAGLLAGEVTVMMEGTDLVVPHVKAGRLRALAVNRDSRLAALPDVPTLDEVGVSGMGRAWVGIVAPAGTPREIVDRLNREFAAALESPDIKAYYEEAGRVTLAGSPDAFAARIREEIPKWRELVKRVGIQVN
jgi:tripartite-type tricarboxylate transporter receptor subunit TctC